MNNKNKPEIRFKEFNDDWKLFKLLDIANYRNGKAHESDIDENGTYIVVNSKFISTDGEIRKFSNKQNEPLFQNEIAFVLSDVPNGRAIAKTFLIDESNKYTLNQRIAGITPHNDVNPKFLAITMNRNKYFLQFDDGIKQTNLSVDDMKKYEAYYPIKLEQDKIGDLFNNIDNLITFHQHKYENLIKVKKSLLEKMFPKNVSKTPEIRFKEFNDDWKNYKIKDIGENFNVSALSYADLSSKGKYKCVLYGELYTRYNERIIDVVLRTDNEATLVQRNDILFPTSSTVDAVSLISPACVNEDNIRVGGDMFGIRPHKNIDGNFISYYINNFQSIKYLLSKKAQGLTIVHLHYNAIKDQEIKIPILEEQNKMSKFLIDIDNLITLHQQKLEKLKNIREAMMQKMLI